MSMISPTVKREARRELARRESARRWLVDFCEYVAPWYRAARHHQLVAGYLEQVERFIATKGAEGIGRLMIFEPPRYGKSEQASKLFPAWLLGRNPDWRLIIASYGAGLSFRNSRAVRDYIASERYQAVFGQRSALPEPVTISQESRSAEAWDLADHRGGMVAAGVGGGITGHGAHLLIIDDPFKSRDEADSQALRERVWEWYCSVAYTRLEDWAAIVLFHTRWHQDDLAGRLLKAMAEGGGGEQWTVVSLPAMAEHHTDSDTGARLSEGVWVAPDLLGRKPGEALWPEKYSVADLERIRGVIGSYDYDSLYQQRPWKLEGTLIKARDIIVIEASEVPADVATTRYWDLAVSGSESADYISGGMTSRGQDGRLYIRDIVRLPGPWADARARMIDVMLQDPVEVEQGIEVAGQQAGYFQELQRDARLSGRVLRAVNPKAVGSKTVRANLWASRIPDGLVHMVRGPWNGGFVAEATAFPRGDHDDQVDAVSGGFQMLGAGHHGIYV